MKRRSSAKTESSQPKTKAEPAQPKRKRGRPKGSTRPPKPDPVPPAILALDKPPVDPLAAEAWMHDMLVASFHDAATDPKLTAAVRRKEMRTIAQAVSKTMPRKRIYEAEQMIKRDRKELEDAKARRGAKLEPVPTVPADAA